MTILLRPFIEDDFKNIVDWIETPEEMVNWSATNFSFPLDEIQLAKHLDRIISPNSNRLAFQAIAIESNEAIGHIELVRIDRIELKASLAFVLIAPHKRRQGLGEKTIAATIDYCFEIVHLEKLDLFVIKDNIPAVNCYQKIGFEIEETIDNKLVINGTNKALYLMGLERQNWTSYMQS
jgi:RimJ/RimL family protein N-acetyltransferase